MLTYALLRVLLCQLHIVIEVALANN
jgi:hypothetical protein